MKRIIDHTLSQWKDDAYRKPLLLRGARQVGKTYAIRQLSHAFEHFIEINFEQTPQARTIFEKDLQPERINQELFWLTGKQIIPGKTLLFFDEIQMAPKALTALRYFYEQLPMLHVIAAGSLLDFAIQEVGIPVGRVSSLYMYPLSFLEFLTALGHQILVEAILNQTVDTPFSPAIHLKLLDFLGHYCAIGGMPEAVSRWQETQDPSQCALVHQTLLSTYHQDFSKYAKHHQIKGTELVFNQIPRQLGQKFKYSLIEGDYRKRDLAPCMDLLTTAGVVHQLFQADGHGLPIGAQANISIYKTMLLDVALNQAALDLDLRDWLLASQQSFINKGALVEAFVGQELLVYADAYKKEHLYFWQRLEKNSEAEVDYLIQMGGTIIPIEVKSGAGSTLRSMHSFLQSHPNSLYGIRFSTQNYSIHEQVQSYPLYAIGAVLIKDKKAAIAALC